MKKILIAFVFIAIIQQLFISFQMRNIDDLNPNDLYEIVLQKNGVTK